MRNVSSPARFAAQALASQVAISRGAAAKHVFIAVVEGGNDSDLFYSIFSTRNGAHESTRLLCSATSLQRLDAHLVGFIDNLELRTSGLTVQQKNWAADHDWYVGCASVGAPGDIERYQVTVRSFDCAAEPFKTFADYAKLRAWAGY